MLLGTVGCFLCAFGELWVLLGAETGKRKLTIASIDHNLVLFNFYSKTLNILTLNKNMMAVKNRFFSPCTKLVHHRPNAPGMAVAPDKDITSPWRLLYIWSAHCMSTKAHGVIKESVIRRLRTSILDDYRHYPVISWSVPLPKLSSG